MTTTTNDANQSRHLQCVRNCVSIDCIGEQSKEKFIKDTSSDPEKSPTNNNNNNNTTNSNSNTVHFHSSTTSSSNNITSTFNGSDSNGDPCFVSSLICSETTSTGSNVCCSSNNPLVSSCSEETVSQKEDNCKSALLQKSGAEEIANERDVSSESSCKNSSLKISENHLSTKLVRNKSSPYTTTTTTTTIRNSGAEVKQNGDKSNHSQVNPSAPRNDSSTSTSCFITLCCDESRDMLDNVPVIPSVQDNCNHNNRSSIGRNNGVQGNNISENNLNSPNLMGSNSILSTTTGIHSSGVNYINNMVIKTEPNGNSIELNTLDNQFHPHNHNNHQVHQHFQSNNRTDCCTTTTTSTNLLLNPNHSAVVEVGDSSESSSGIDAVLGSSNMQPHDTFLASLNSQSNNHNNQVCQNELFVNSCVHNCGGMSLATGNGSMGSISGNSNGAGSMTSPGGSLDEHDCDDDKVINGDTFATGDLPDADSIKMFVGQVPKHLNEPELRTLFEEFGRVFQINVLRDKASKQSKGCCFVTFYTRKAALDAQNALHNVKTLPGMNHPLQMKPADNENRSERKLFVGMLSRKCTEADVRNIFSRFGVIDEVSVLRDNSNNQSRGCAFVTFASKQNALNAIKAVHHSTTMEGCSSPIVVKFADTEKDKHQKRQQNMQNTLMGNMSGNTGITQPPLYTILQHLQQPQQQQTGYYSQLLPGVHQSLTAGLGLGATTGSSMGLGSSPSSTDLATIFALSNLTNASSQQQILANLATLAALSPSTAEYLYAGANGCSLGSANALGLTGSGLQTGLNTAYSPVIRNQTIATKQTEGPEGANLFIYHLPPECGDLDLAQMFAPYGNVISAKVFVDKQTNLSKCFGFVSYDSPLTAQLAIQQMNGFQIGMKRLKVQLKRPKDAAKPY